MSEVKIRLKEYHKDFINYLKSIKAKYDSLTNTWIVDYSNFEEVKNKIKEFNLDSKVEISVKVPVTKKEKPQEGKIVMRLSKDGRYALLSINLLAFKEDIELLISGKKKIVRFRVLPYKRKTNSSKGKT